MVANVVYFGIDNRYRIRDLRNAGYSVDNCTTLSELRIVLFGGRSPDAIAIDEPQGALSKSAVSLARSFCPDSVLLFQAWTSHAKESDFDLVVPPLTESRIWLDALAQMIELNRISLVGPRPAVRRIEKIRERSRLLTCSNEFLNALPLGAIRDLESLLTTAYCKAGTILFAEEQKPSEIFILLDGEVVTYVNSEQGHRIHLHIAEPGEFLGLSAAFTTSPHTMSAEALKPCTVASMSCGEFNKFLLLHPRACQLAARELGLSCNRACMRLRSMEENRSKAADLSRLLLEWTAGGETGVQIHMALSEGELAENLECGGHAVSRMLHDLERQRVIELRGSLLTVIDGPALGRSARLQ